MAWCVVVLLDNVSVLSVSMRTANVFLSFDDPECVCAAKKAYQLAEGTHRDLYDAVRRLTLRSA